MPTKPKLLLMHFRHHSPWLEWAGKQETKSFTVDPVALHIHERVSAKAILKVAEHQNVQRELFADPRAGLWRGSRFLPTRCGLGKPPHSGG